MTIGRYADAKFEYLSYCLKVKEMDDEEQSYHSLQEPSYRVETGNYEYRYEPSHWNQSHWNQSHCSMLQYFFNSTWLYLTLLDSTLLYFTLLYQSRFAMSSRSQNSFRRLTLWCTGQNILSEYPQNSVDIFHSNPVDTVPCNHHRLIWPSSIQYYQSFILIETFAPIFLPVAQSCHSSSF